MARPVARMMIRRMKKQNGYYSRRYSGYSGRFAGRYASRRFYGGQLSRGAAVANGSLFSNDFSVSRFNFGFPMHMRTKLKYVAPLTLSSVAGVIASNTYSANGIFDPDVTGVGHQPLGRDKLAAIYGTYQVINSWIKVTSSLSVGFAATPGIRFGILRTPFNAIASIGSSVMEIGSDVVKKVVLVAPPIQPQCFMRTDGIAQYLGLNTNDDTLLAAMGSNPTGSQLYYIVWMSGLTDADTTGSVAFTVEIVYDVLCTNTINSEAQN